MPERAFFHGGGSEEKSENFFFGEKIVNEDCEIE